MRERFYIGSSLELRTGSTVLADRLRRLNPQSWKKQPQAKIFTTNDTPAIPKVGSDGRLRFGAYYQPHPMPQNGEKYYFYLPKYRIQHYNQNGLNLPHLKIEWLAAQNSVVGDEDVVAELVVRFEPIKASTRHSTREIEHNLTVSLVYYALDQNGQRKHRVELLFDRVSRQQDGRLIAYMNVVGKSGLARIVGALSTSNCRPRFVLSAAAEMHIPAVSYVVDLATMHKPKFHESLWKTGFVAENAVTPSKLRESAKKPFSNRRRPVTLNERARVHSNRNLRRSTTTVTATATAAPAPRAAPTATPTVMLSPMIAGTSFTPIINPIIVAAITPERVKPIMMTTTKAFRAPNNSVVSSFIKAAALTDKGMDKKEIAKRFNTTPIKVGDRRAIIPLTIKNRAGDPVLIKKELTASMHLSSFYAIENFGQVYGEVPDHIMDEIRGFKDPTILVAYNVVVGNEHRVVYQDPLQANHFFYVPDKYKLGRADNPPFEPLMRIGFQELLLEKEESDQVDLNYRVQITFTCLPELDPEFLSAARTSQSLITAAGGEEIVLSPLDSDSVALELDEITTSLGGEIVEQEISLTTGVMVTIEVDSSVFSTLFTRLTNDAGVPAITGRLRVPMLVGAQKTIELSVSLYDMVGAVFSQQWGRQPNDPQGNYRMWLTNQTESTVHVKSSRAWVMAEEQRVSASIHNDQMNFSVAPGGNRELQLQVDPTSATVRDLTVETQHSFTLDVDALWRLITINHGLSSYAFSVDVVMEMPEIFGTSPAEGVPPLSALKVEFQEGPDIELTAQQSRVEAILYKSLLSDLQNQPLTEGYTYRVVNIHGTEEWARGNWTKSHGTLRVMPVAPGT